MWVPVPPIAKQRARLSARRRGRKTKAYTPERTASFEAAVRDWWTENGQAHYGGVPVQVDVKIRRDGFYITITPKAGSFRPVGIRGDVDNYAKSIQDALNGVAWDDDRQVEDVRVRLDGAERKPRFLAKRSEQDGEG